MARLTAENEAVKETMAQQGQALAALGEAEKAAKEAAADHLKARELLALDKQFLQQEVRGRGGEGHVLRAFIRVPRRRRSFPDWTGPDAFAAFHY